MRGTLLVELDRDRVLKVGEQLNNNFHVGFPGEKDLLREQFLLALAEEVLWRLRDLHLTWGADHVDVDELWTALFRLRDERRKRLFLHLQLREVREYNRGGGRLKGRPPTRAVRPQVVHWVYHAILAMKRVDALFQQARGACRPLAEDTHHYLRPLLFAGQHGSAQLFLQHSLQLFERLVTQLLLQLLQLQDEDGPGAL